jgi:hypothetical protein
MHVDYSCCNCFLSAHPQCFMKRGFCSRSALLNERIGVRNSSSVFGLNSDVTEIYPVAYVRPLQTNPHGRTNGQKLPPYVYNTKKKLCVYLGWIPWNAVFRTPVFRSRERALIIRGGPWLSSRVWEGGEANGYKNHYFNSIHILF